MPNARPAIASPAVVVALLTTEDNARLKLAVERIDAAARVLVEADAYRPGVSQ